MKILHHSNNVDGASNSVNWLKFDPLTGALASGGDNGYCIVWDLSCLLPDDVEVGVLCLILSNL